MPDRPGTEPATSAGHPVRQLDRSRADGSWCDAGGRPRGARLASLLPHEPGLRQAAPDPGARAPGDGLRGADGSLRTGAEGARSRRCGARGQRPAATGPLHHTVLGASKRDTGTCRCPGRGRSRTRYGREDPLHLGLDGASKGRAQHPANALREPADAGAVLALREADPARTRGLAALESHLWREPQLQSRTEAGRHALDRRGEAGTGTHRDDIAEPARDLAESLFQTSPLATRSSSPTSRTTASSGITSSAIFSSSSTPRPPCRKTSGSDSATCPSRPTASAS